MDDPVLKELVDPHPKVTFKRNKSIQDIVTSIHLNYGAHSTLVKALSHVVIVHIVNI